MAKEKASAETAFWQEVFHAGIYKRNQGRIARQVTFFAIALVAAIGCYQMSRTVLAGERMVQFGIPALVFGLVLWTAYRLVNWPPFSDFLISVEAEMQKVSWPTRHELFRGSVVVLITILFLAAVLFLYDAVWGFVFKALGVIG